MSYTEYRSTNDINHPDHRAKPGELFMGLVAVASAFATAAVITEFHPNRK